jgi:hypothetical protein
MQPSTIAPKPKKPPKWWAAVTIAAGIIGAFAGLAAGASGTYEVPPFTVELSAKPAPAGKTEFEVKPAALSPGFAEAGTHASPLVLRATVVDIDGELLASDAAALATPSGFADHFAQNGKAAATAFAIKSAIVALLGSLAAGAAISFGRWQRIVGALVIGIVTVGALGAITAVTYDKDEFKKTSFQRGGPGSLIPGG